LEIILNRHKLALENLSEQESFFLASLMSKKLVFGRLEITREAKSLEWFLNKKLLGLNGF
jgi:hypothetical protein